MANGLCFGCLRRKHLYKDCRFRNPVYMADSVPRSVAPSMTPLAYPKSAAAFTHAGSSAVLAASNINSPQPPVPTVDAKSCPGSSGKSLDHYYSLSVPVRVYNKSDPKKYMIV